MSTGIDTGTEPPWSSSVPRGAATEAIGVTVLYHPDPARVGEIAVLADRGSRQRASLGRSSPSFRRPSGAATRALDVPQLSDREPLLLVSLPSGGLRLEHTGERMQILVDGEPLRASRELPPEALTRGVVLVLGRAVALLVHGLEVDATPQPELGLIGHSRALRALRADILRVADRDVPVLLRGETGVGKELVAAALHEHSPRREGPYVAVNMAAIPPSMAEAELFGAKRGSFTGATHDRQGHFEVADGGTLFLDEIGDAPPEVQAKLLRVTQHKELQPLGGRTQRVDVRLIAATDSDLERAVATGSFRRPLLQRVSGYVVHVPTLRERIDDIPRLFLCFLRQELHLQGELERLLPPLRRGAPWLPLSFVLRLVAYGFPGNVRELLNAARQVAIANRGAPTFRTPEPLQHLPASPLHAPEARSPRAEAETLPPLPSTQPTTAPQPPRAPRPPQRRAGLPSDDEIVAALERCGYNISRAAAELEISRTTVHTRMGRCAALRNASEISDAELDAVLSASNGDRAQAAASLRVSDRALLLRMRRRRP